MKLQRRIALHFSLQFILLLVFTFFFLSLLLLFLANLVSIMEMRTRTTDAVIETIPAMIIIDGDEVTLEEKWIQELKNNEIWLQVINKDGKVIYSINSPDSLQSSYTVHELLWIDEVKQIDEYKVRTVFDSWLFGEDYYFIFGFRNNQQEMLAEWFNQYGVGGKVDESYTVVLEEKLQSLDGVLQVYQNEELVQTIGANGQETLAPLEIIGRLYEPGRYETKVSVYSDPMTNSTWMLHLPSSKSAQTGWLIPLRETQILIIAIVASLVVAILFSIWNGYRYGRPLLLIMNWLQRMEKENYDGVFTEKELKKVFKKNGKIKFRYRLYKEVIQAFYSMTEKLEKAKQERERLEKTREEWMAGISHDLRTPLSTIQGYGHLMESNKYTFSEKELHEIGKVIREKSDYMVQLVEDFSLVFQLRNSAIQLEKQKINLNNFIRKKVMTLERDMTLKDFTFSFKERDSPCFIDIDPKWFVRVLDNLIYNAVKHNPPGTHIEIGVKADGAITKIFIQDNGIGMDKDFITNLFERYYRGTTTTEKTEGAGLGMSIAKAIVELHDGTIDVHSEVGKGTIVFISLPKGEK